MESYNFLISMMHIRPFGSLFVLLLWHFTLDLTPLVAIGVLRYFITIAGLCMMMDNFQNR